MLAEVNLFGVFIAPVAVYAFVSLFVGRLVKVVLWRCGALEWFWHIALFEIALYVCILCLLLLYV